MIGYTQLRGHIRRHVRYLPFDRRRGGPGKNIAPATGAWTLALNGGAAGTITQDATGITFASANNSAHADATGIGVVDNGVYLLQFTVSGLTSGSVKPQLYGATLNHFAGGTVRGNNGTFTEILKTTNTGSFTNQLRFLANGANGTNSYKVSNITLRRIT